MRVILIPGLGYDCRIFRNLHFSAFEPECLKWIEPNQNEEIGIYAKRMFEQVTGDRNKIILIGHSFGGIIAQEIASQIKIDKIILISSIKSRKELPVLFKMVKPLFLFKLFTKEISIQSIRFWGRNHGFETFEDKQLFKNMVSGQTNNYLQWALKMLSAWEGRKIPNTTEIIQIHGTNDNTFPIRLIEKPEFIVENGSHIFVYKNATKATEIIEKRIEIH